MTFPIELSFYPHMPIGMFGIYRLLFVFFCLQDFGNGYLGWGLTQGNEILQDGRLPGLLPFW